MLALALFRSGRDEDATTMIDRAMETVRRYYKGPWTFSSLYCVLAALSESEHKSRKLRKRKKMALLRKHFAQALVLLNRHVNAVPINAPKLT